MNVREVVHEDAAALHDLLADPEVAAHLNDPPATVEQFEGFIEWSRLHRERGDGICFGIVPQGLVAAVGVIQLRALEPSFFTAEWGFGIGRAFWATGVFPEAARLVAQYGFSSLGIHRIEARAVSINGRGNGVLQKLGARAEGLLTSGFRKAERREQQLLWSLTVDDLKQASTGRGFSTARAEARILAAVAELRTKFDVDRTTARARRPEARPYFLTGGDPAQH